jgi:hypothetical protein
MSVLQSASLGVALTWIIVMTGCNTMPEAAYDHEAKMLWVGLGVKI